MIAASASATCGLYGRRYRSSRRIRRRRRPCRGLLLRGKTCRVQFSQLPMFVVRLAARCQAQLAASSSSSSCFRYSVGVEPAVRDELVVRAALDDAAAVEHDDLIGVAHGRDAVRDDDRRPLPHHAAQPRQDLLLRVGVHRRQRVVQDQDARIDHQRARERRALLLAARQRDAALADQRVVALRETPRRPCRAARRRPPRCTASLEVGVRRLRAGDLRRRTRCSPRSVSENRNGSCGTKPIAPRSVGERDLADVDAVDEDRAGRRVVQPRQQADRASTCPDPVAPTIATRLARLDAERDVIEHRPRRCPDR